MTLFTPPKYPNADSSRSENRKSKNAIVVRGLNYLIIGGFLLGLALPFLGLFQGDVSEEIEKNEGRPAAAFPQLEIKTSSIIPRPETRSVKEFPKQFEKWLNDRIGFRKQLIQVYQVARHYGWTCNSLSKSPAGHKAAVGVIGHMNQGGTVASGQDRVLIGREGWLFYQTDSVIDDYRGTDLFTENELAQWKKVITERRDWLAKRGIRYLFVVAPNKHSIYPEYMPRSVNRVSTESRLSQLADYMARESDVRFISLLEPMLAAKSQQRLYHKTDTHWNACGAFVGAQQILKPLKEWFPDVYVPTLNDYQVVVHDCDTESVRNVAPWIKMDLAVMQGSPIPHREEVIDLVPNRPELQVSVQFQGEPQ
ncbi:MAG: hypothetical protein KDA84_01080, partial [Planctomycetaceae bacterium]|nr:hypothetical protein [Planctomycetaceae bacterium]